MRLRSLVLALGLLAPPAGAEITYQVDSDADYPDANPNDGMCASTAGGCTLRAAVQLANVTGGVIRVPAVRIGLTMGFLDVTHTMRIEGAGMQATEINGNLVSGILRAHSSSGSISLIVTDMILRNGKLTSGYGGAIYADSDAVVVLQRCYVAVNQALLGGAFYCGSGALLTVQDSTLVANHSTTSGGALYAEGCSLTLERSTLNGNTSGGSGAGLYAVGGSTKVINSTIGGNTAEEDGGAIFAGGSGSTTTLKLYNATVAGNRAKRYAGGIVSALNAAVTLENSILASNLNGSDGGFLAISDCNGTVTATAGVILSSTNFCTVNGNKVVTSPHLGGLGDNGGRTQTYPLLSSSPAIDGGTFGGCFAGTQQLTTDQRGVNRVIGARCDIGAYERSPCGDANGDGGVNVNDVLFIINTLFAGGPFPPGLANVNGDPYVNVNDVLYLINNLFAGGPSPSCPGT